MSFGTFLAVAMIIVRLNVGQSQKYFVIDYIDIVLIDIVIYSDAP